MIAKLRPKIANLFDIFLNRFVEAKIGLSFDRFFLKIKGFSQRYSRIVCSDLLFLSVWFVVVSLFKYPRYFC